MLYEIRQTPVLLFTRLVVLELLVSLLHLSIRPLFDWLQLADLTLAGITAYWLVIIILQVLNLIFFISIVLNWLSFVYIIEDDEIRVITGVLRRKQTRYGAKNLEKIQSDQNIWGKIFGYGNVTAYNPVLGRDITLHGISSPERYARILEQLPELQKEKNLNRDINILRSR
ncbi:MAG TPA: PH domain-containing protein [bacterium]|nr:PH domain-containing protein [bacterium]